MRQAIRHSSTQLTPLSFEEICPDWSDKLKKDLGNDDIQTLSRKPEQCIVGEAWGHTSRYLGYRVVYLIPFVGCWKCINYGNKIGKTAKQHNELCKRYLQPIIDDFVDHWNEKHLEITFKKRKERKEEMLITTNA